MGTKINRRRFVRTGLTGLGGLAAGGTLATWGWAANYTTLLTSNFQIQFDPAEFTGAVELALVTQRAEVLGIVCEPEYATLCDWFGLRVGAGLGPSNRVIVTLTKGVRGGINYGYSTHNPRMSVNPYLDASDDSVLGIFVAEMIEILMRYKGPWDPLNSGGEGLSRVAAQLLHPQYGQGFVNAWLAGDPNNDPTSAVDDSEFRKDWVTKNFNGGPLKAGGAVHGDDDSYSYGCAMLFLYYLKSQLGYSMPQIVQNGGATLADTYRKLTGGKTNAFWAFKSLLAEHFPIGAQSATDNPFPLSPVSVSTKLAPGAVSSGNTTAQVVTRSDGRILYTWWELGQGSQGFGEMEGSGRSDTGPAATLVGPQHNYLFVVVRGLDGRLYVNQGELGKSFVGWQEFERFQTNLAPGTACSGNTSAAVAVYTDGRIFYTWWELGQGSQGFRELEGDGRSDAAPAATLVGPQHNYLFVVVKGLDGHLYHNQGELGKFFVGWQPFGFQTNLAPGATSSGDTSAVVAVGTDGRIFYDWWDLGHGGRGFKELDGDGRTDAAPAAALVGPQHNYLFVVIKGLDGRLYVNQGELGKSFVGWLPLG